MATNPYGWTTQASQSSDFNPQQQMQAWNQNAFDEQQRIFRTQGREAADAWSRNMEGQQAAYAQSIGFNPQNSMYRPDANGAQNRMMQNFPNTASAAGFQGPMPGAPTGMTGNQYGVQGPGPGAGGVPGVYNPYMSPNMQGQGFQYQPQNQGMPNMQQAWGALSDFGRYGSHDYRQQAEDFTKGFMQPYMNYALQAGDQAFNQQYQTWNANEQQRLNNFNMGVTGQQMQLNRDAFNLGANQWNQQFGEGRRQFDVGANQWNQQFGEGQRQFNVGADQWNRQFGENTRQFDVSANQLANWQSGQLAQGNRSLDLQAGRDQFNQGYQNRQLQQEADLMREKYQNDLTQSRYSAFGRAQTPNFRQMGGWK